jgi:hypothetical protein
MNTAYFCIFENSEHTMSRVEIRAVQPEPVAEPPGWVPKYVAILSDGPLEGAEIVLARMEREFCDRRVGRGLYTLDYPTLRRWLDEQFAHPEKYGPPPVAGVVPAPTLGSSELFLRILAGAGASLLLVAFVVINVWATFLWFFYITVRRRRWSPLTTMAETNVLFSLLDWRRAIYRLTNIALNRTR